MINFENIAEYLKEPLVLIGFGLLIFYFLFRNILKAKLLKRLSKEVSEIITIRIFNSIIIIVSVIILLGFGLQLYRDTKYLDYDNKNKHIQLIKIENLKNKIFNFNFNIVGNDSIKLKYKSVGWGFEAPFYIDPSFKVKDLKAAIMDHFELKRHLKFHSNGGWLNEYFVFKANNRVIFDESLSLLDAGINTNDVVTIQIVVKYQDYEMIEQNMEEIEEN